MEGDTLSRAELKQVVEQARQHQGFPWNKRVTVAKADRIAAAVKRSGMGGVMAAHDKFGMSRPEMLSYLHRNFRAYWVV